MKHANYRHYLTRTIKATCSFERFIEFYTSIADLAKEVKLLFTKRLNSYIVTFELSVTY